MHHPAKALFDFGSVALAASSIAIAHDYIPYLLAIPSAVYGSIQLIEWILNKLK